MARDVHSDPGEYWIHQHVRDHTLGHGGPNRGEAIRIAVLRYLSRHPMACDTVAGICAWWLPEEGLHEDRVLVEEALDRLVDRTEVSRVELADGTRLYGASRGDGRT